MSDNNALVDLDLPVNTSNNQGPVDPFDLIAPSGTTTNGVPASEDLLDLDFGPAVTAGNGTSAKVNLEPDAHPLYDFSTSGDIMASEPSDIDTSADSTQNKCSESSSALYDFIENDTTHKEDSGVILTADGSGHVDLLAEMDPMLNDQGGVTTDTNNEVDLDIQDEYANEETASETEEVDQDGIGTEDQRLLEGGVKVNGTAELNENGLSDDEPERDPNVFRETHDKEEVHFSELNDFRQRFESGSSNEPVDTVPRQISIKDEYAESGEYESTPIKDPDIAREQDQSAIGEELPEVGMARNLMNKFHQLEKDSPAVPKPSARISPPRQNEVIEYESTPTPKIEQYEGKSESGIFESMPKAREDVVRAVDQVEDEPLPEKGTARNLVSRFKEYEVEAAKVQTREKKELTPDRSGKVEYTSEPRSTIESYEGKTESGVFENIPQEEEDVVKSSEVRPEFMPESGMAKSILSKFKEYESEVGDKLPPSPTRQREITPDRTGKVEYISEPRGFLEKYEPKEESGVFENDPSNRAEVIKCDEGQEDILPEAGTAKRTMERFKELQKQSSSPVTSQHRQITPPPEVIHGKTVSGVLESTPEKHTGEVIRSGDTLEEELPEQGMAKNLLNKFKQIQSESYSPPSSAKHHKEFTPPPESGVYESTPSASLKYEERVIESGITENTPSKSYADVRDADYVPLENELPEKGAAKSMVSKFRLLESENVRNPNSASPIYKEFTPPRDSRGLLSPKSPIGAVSGVQPSELPSQYQQSTESGVYENEPVSQSDVYREADTDWTEGLPAENTTKSMLDKFKAFQQKAIEDQETPKPISRKDKGLQFAIPSEKCDACGKTVYVMEKMELNNHVYHRKCFKCSHCSARLTPNTYSMNEGIVYCMYHFKQLFARKGNYDEGFGRQQYKKRWRSGEHSVKKSETA